MTEIKNIALKDLHNNTGFEIESGRVNANPRVIRDAQYKNLLRSLRESNMTDIMPLKVFEHDGKYIVIGGNMRLRALRELKAESVDCILIPQTYTADMLNKAIIIDNSTHGDWDMDMLANEWNADLLSVWGIDLPPVADDEPTDLEATPKDKPFVVKLTFDSDQRLQDFLLCYQDKLRDEFNCVISISGGEL